MWPETLPNGKINFRERYRDKKTGKIKKVGHVMDRNTAQSRKEAYRILQEKINKKLNEIDEEYTFGEIFNLYIEYLKPRRAEGTINIRMSDYKNHIKPYPFNDYLITEIIMADIQEVIDNVQYKKGLARNTAISVKSTITGPLNYAQRHRQIDLVTTGKGIELKEENKEIDADLDKFIDSDILESEIKRMYDLLPFHTATILEGQILTGMRIGEITSLVEGDWDGESINITKGVKNKESIRTISTSERLNEIISNNIAMNKIQFGERADLIFPSTLNTKQSRNFINRKLKLLNEDYTTHVMRHTHITLLAENNFDLNYIMRRVGHVDPKTTLRIYTHITNKMKQENQEKLDHLF